MGRLLTLLRKKGGEFNPLDLPGLALWLDASDLSTITHASGFVSQWDDKSGNAKHFTQGTLASQPETGIRTINSRNVLDFDGPGSSDFLGNTALSLTQPTTAFIVHKLDLTTTQQRIFYGSGSSPDAYNVDADSSSKYDVFVGNTGLLDAGTVTTGTRVATVLLNGAASNIRLDGASQKTGNAGDRAATALYIGSRNDLANPTDGAIAEVIIYGSALSVADREVVEGYLAAKWGVTLA